MRKVAGKPKEQPNFDRKKVYDIKTKLKKKKRYKREGGGGGEKRNQWNEKGFWKTKEHPPFLTQQGVTVTVSIAFIYSTVQRRRRRKRLNYFIYHKTDPIISAWQLWETEHAYDTYLKREISIIVGLYFYIIYI